MLNSNDGVKRTIHTTHKSTTETVHKKLQEVFFSNLTYCMPSEYRQPHWDTCSEAHVNINYTTSHERPKRKTCRRLTKKSRANFFPASAQPPTSCSVGHITYYVGKMTVFWCILLICPGLRCFNLPCEDALWRIRLWKKNPLSKIQPSLHGWTSRSPIYPEQLGFFFHCPPDFPHSDKIVSEVLGTIRLYIREFLVWMAYSRT